MLELSPGQHRRDGAAARVDADEAVPEARDRDGVHLAPGLPLRLVHRLARRREQLLGVELARPAGVAARRRVVLLAAGDALGALVVDARARRRRADVEGEHAHYPEEDGSADRIRPPQGVLRRPAVRRRLVQGRAARPARALRPERRREDDAPARAHRRDRAAGRRARLGEGCASRAARPAAAAARRTHPARVHALGRGRSRRRRAGAPPARGGDGRGRPRARDAAPVRRGAGATRACGRLRLARPRDERPPRPRLHRRGPRPRPRVLLRRRADARLARARAGRRARSPAARRADEPPRHGLDRVARAGADLDRRGGRDRGARPLVPRVRDDGRARARERQVGLLPRPVARVAAGAGRPGLDAGEVRGAAGGGHRAPRALRGALPLRHEVAPGAGEAEADRADREGARRGAEGQAAHARLRVPEAGAERPDGARGGGQ